MDLGERGFFKITITARTTTERYYAYQKVLFKIQLVGWLNLNKKLKEYQQNQENQEKVQDEKDQKNDIIIAWLLLSIFINIINT